MNWWGKVLGGTFGYMLGGPLGALIGAALGHRVDRGMEGAGLGAGAAERERIQTAFFTATFSVLGHMAKADGRVSEAEIQLALSVMDQMQLDEEQRAMARRLFREGKQAHFDLDAVLEQFVRVCHRRRTLLRIFLEILVQAALVDGRLDPNEHALLRRICGHIGFSTSELEHLIAMVQAARGGQGPTTSPEADLDRAYSVLGVSASSSDTEIKRAYRRLISQHHPDKLVARGLPEEMMKVATEKTREIRKAYELVKKHRGF